MANRGGRCERDHVDRAALQAILERGDSVGVGLRLIGDHLVDLRTRRAQPFRQNLAGAGGARQQDTAPCDRLQAGQGIGHGLGHVLLRHDLGPHAPLLERRRGGGTDGRHVHPVGQPQRAAGFQLVPESRHTVRTRKDDPIVGVQLPDRLPERRRLRRIRYPDGRAVHGLGAQPAQADQQPLSLCGRARHGNAAAPQRLGP